MLVCDRLECKYDTIMSISYKCFKHILRLCFVIFFFQWYSFMLGQKVLHAQSIFFNFVVGVHQTLNLFYFSVAKRPFIIRLQNVVVLTLKCTFEYNPISPEWLCNVFTFLVLQQFSDLLFLFLFTFVVRRRLNLEGNVTFGSKQKP